MLLKITQYHVYAQEYTVEVNSVAEGIAKVINEENLPAGEKFFMEADDLRGMSLEGLNVTEDELRNLGVAAEEGYVPTIGSIEEL